MLQSLVFVCCVALFPAKPMVPPRALVTLRRLFLRLFSFAAVRLCPFFVSRVVVGPPAGYRTARFFVSCVSAVFLSSLPSGLFVPLFGWSISWTNHRRTDRTSK